jgi:undecaprenyl-diphosphatase
LESIKALDEGLFRLLNVEFIHPLLDIFMPWVTEPKNFYLFFVVTSLGLIIWGGSKGRKALVLVLIAILISDQSTMLLKEQLQRIRPCNAVDNARLLIGCTQSFSLPSAHAANIFSAAAILSFTYKKTVPFFLLIAFLVAYSRIYVGVHYPLDVLAGSFLGLISAAVILLIEKEMHRIKGPFRMETKLGDE